MLDEHGRLLSADAVRAQLRDAGVEDGDHDVVASCGSGVTACHTLLVLEALGRPGARLFPGSYSQWSRSTAPVETGQEAGRRSTIALSYDTPDAPHMDDPLLRSRHRRTLAQIHARAAEIHESSAQRLRATGPEAAAARVERFAATARDRIEHPAAIARLSAYAWRVRECARMSDALDQALDGAMAFLGADFGNLQLVGPRAPALRIVAHRGFGDAFLDHFAVVDDAQLACGRAAATRAQAVIADVEYDADFAPHRAIAAASGFRAVQSTPLVDRSGRLVGVLSTHFREPHRPAPYELRLTEVYADMVADGLARRRSAA